MNWVVMARSEGDDKPRQEGSSHVRREAARLMALRLSPMPLYDLIYIHNTFTGEVETVKQTKPDPPPVKKKSKFKTRKADSVRSIILRAAESLPHSFTISQLVVAVWEHDKQRFGLSGYEDKYPDSCKVFPYLCGQRGLVGVGVMRRLADGRYQLITTQGVS